MDTLDEKIEARARDRALAMIGTLCETFPKAFCWPPRPLTVGVYYDIVLEMFPDRRKDLIAFRASQEGQTLSRALRYWTGHAEYLAGTAFLGAPRIGLTGEVEGHVTEEQAQHAIQRLKSLGLHF